MAKTEMHPVGTAAVEPGRWEPRIIGFLCYWCSYAGADGAGMARRTYPPNVDVVRVMCSGRVDPQLVTKAFASGADGVIVCGCHVGDCHYREGNHRTMVRIPLLQRVLGELGIEPERFRLEWVSAAEGDKFARVVAEMTEQVRRLGPLGWEELMERRGVGHGRDLAAWGA